MSMKKKMKIMGPLAILGIVFIFLGFFLLLLSLLQSRGKIESGGLILIGPFPIIWGSSKVIVLFLLFMTIIILLFLILYSIIIVI